MANHRSAYKRFPEHKTTTAHVVYMISLLNMV